MKTFHASLLKNKVKADRLTGMGINLLSQKYGVSRTTIYYWIKDIELSAEARFQLKRNSDAGREKGRLILLQLRQSRLEEIKQKAKNDLLQINLDQYQAKLICACLFWAEGSKKLDSVTFTNSDPAMIKTFLALLRKAFLINEGKLRALIHLHPYHNSENVHLFWSNITQIPLTQFTKPYLKANSGINIKENYQGCICINYFDAQIAKELYWLYTTLHQKIDLI